MDNNEYAVAGWVPAHLKGAYVALELGIWAASHKPKHKYAMLSTIAQQIGLREALCMQCEISPTLLSLAKLGLRWGQTSTSLEGS
jgi:hypothetical protein